MAHIKWKVSHSILLDFYEHIHRTVRDEPLGRGHMSRSFQATVLFLHSHPNTFTMDKSFQATISGISKSTKTPDMMCRGVEKGEYMTVNLSLIMGHIEGGWPFAVLIALKDIGLVTAGVCEVTGDGGRACDR